MYLPKGQPSLAIACSDKPNLSKRQSHIRRCLALRTRGGTYYNNIVHSHPPACGCTCVHGHIAYAYTSYIALSVNSVVWCGVVEVYMLSLRLQVIQN